MKPLRFDYIHLIPIVLFLGEIATVRVGSNKFIPQSVRWMWMSPQLPIVAISEKSVLNSKIPFPWGNFNSSFFLTPSNLISISIFAEPAHENDMCGDRHGNLTDYFPYSRFGGCCTIIDPMRPHLSLTHCRPNQNYRTLPSAEVGGIGPRLN